MLHEFVRENREEIIRRCRAKVTVRRSPTPTKAEIDHGVPMFLDELVAELRLGLTPNPDIAKTATQHGHDLLRQGFTVSQVVHDYGDICEAITELAMDLGAPISTDDFHSLNRCLDDAIAGAVTQYEHEQYLDDDATDDSEHLGVMARELRNAIHNASVAFEMIKSGRVGLEGSTGTTLGQSILSSQHLIDRLLDQIYATRLMTDARHGEDLAAPAASLRKAAANS